MTDVLGAHAPRHRRLPDERDGIAANLWLGVAVTVALVAGAGYWIGTASLDGAVIAGGTVVVETSVKKVQHQTGGVVREIRVTDGARVKAGDVVVQLDDTAARGNLDIITDQLDRVRIRIARLQAEVSGSPIMLVPDTLQEHSEDPEIAALMEGERSLLQSRLRSLDSQRTALQSRSGQFAEQIAGLSAQKSATEEALAVLERDYANVRSLFERKLLPQERISTLEMEIARSKGEIGRLTAAIAEAEGRTSELKLQIIQLEDEARKNANMELREAEGREAELVERRQVAADQLARTDIRAPQTGVVQQLAVHTVGGVVSPGETLMLIVPESDELVVDAQVPPQRIDEVAAGQPVSIRFSAFDRNVTPECHGTISGVSPDLIRVEAERYSFYAARVRIDNEKSCLTDAQRLLPGMPVEVHINTGERQVWSYLLKPILDQLDRAFRD